MRILQIALALVAIFFWWLFYKPPVALAGCAVNSTCYVMKSDGVTTDYFKCGMAKDPRCNTCFQATHYADYCHACYTCQSSGSCNISIPPKVSANCSSEFGSSWYDNQAACSSDPNNSCSQKGVECFFCQSSGSQYACGQDTSKTYPTAQACTAAGGYTTDWECATDSANKCYNNTGCQSWCLDESDNLICANASYPACQTCANRCSTCPSAVGCNQQPLTHLVCDSSNTCTRVSGVGVDQCSIEGASCVSNPPSVTSSAICPVPGNNLVDNIDPQVLINLRTEYDQHAKQLGGVTNCWLPETFLMRSPDLNNPAKLARFFQTASSYRIFPFIRAASDNIGPLWDPIDPGTAKLDASGLNSGLAGIFFPDRIFVHFANEPNIPDEWGGHPNPEDFTNSFVAFAEAVDKTKIATLLPPLSLNGASVGGLSPEDFWSRVYKRLMDTIGQDACKGDVSCICQTTNQWIDNNVAGYTVVLLANDPGSVGQLKDDLKRALEALHNAGGKWGCSEGFPFDNKAIVISEFGLKNGEKVANMEQVLWTFYQEIKKYFNGQLKKDDPWLDGSKISAMTSYVRDPNGTVHAYWYVTDPSGNLLGAREYNSNVNIGGSTSLKGGSTAQGLGPLFPPLGTLQACPPEIPVNAEINQQTSPAPGGTSAFYCNIAPKDEPPACKKLLNPDPNVPIPDLIDRNTRWSCYPTSCQTWAKNHPGKGIVGCGRFNDVFCADTAPGIPNDLTWLGRLRAYKDFGAKHGLGQCQPDWFPEQDRNTIAVCLGSHIAADPNFLKGSTPATAVSAQVLPACVPTTQAGQCCQAPLTADSPTTCKDPILGVSSPNSCGIAATCNTATNTCQKLCVSECSEPVQFSEYLTLLPQGDCWRTGTCQANLQIKDGTLYIPYAAMLGNYFGGIFDAENLTREQFAQNQQVIANGPKDPLFEKVWQDAGVAKKLLPQEVQDQLKCDFTKYVQDRKDKNLNSKYISRKPDGTIDGEFKIFDTNVTAISCRNKASDKTKFDNDWAFYWDAVPLFPNDDSQGKIEFVNPSIFTTNTDSTTVKDRQGNPIKIGPVYVSIPEIQKLNLATKEIQALLIPDQKIYPPRQPELIGKEIQPIVSNSACTPQGSWNQFYNSAPGSAQDTLGKKFGLSEFERGVSCVIKPLAGKNDDKICTVGPDGQLKCGRQEKTVPNQNCDASGNCSYSETVQVRTVFPHLYDIAEQTISPATGILQTFRPEIINQTRAAAGSTIDAAANFDENFIPVPASISGVKYELSNTVGLAIDDRGGHKDNGWQLFFYKLGGLVNARNFILQFLQAKGEPTTLPTTGGAPPTTMPTTGGNP